MVFETEIKRRLGNNIDRASLDAMRLITKEAGIQDTEAEVRRRARIQLLIVDAICECLPTSDPRRREVGR